MTASYVGAAYDWDTDKVLVWEREGGERQLRSYPAEHYFFVPHEEGTYRSLLGYPLARLDFDTADEMKRAVRECSSMGRLHESDIPPLFKCLMNRYYGAPVPVIHYAFIDIEVNYSSKIGFSSPKNPYAIINAVTIYQSWSQRYLTYVVPPVVNGVRWSGTVDDLYAKFDELVASGQLQQGQRPEIVICSSESVLLQKMVEAIQDADIISGWNSEFFDLPYIIQRLERVMPTLVKKMCFTGCRPPKQKVTERFGAEEMTYALYGRSHLDYLDLFKKFTFEGRESYSLGNILQQEIGLSKVHYEGTLEQLYHNDFPLFVCYNFRDVSGMVDLDNKFKFIQLVNEMAHSNTCLFENILGTVRYVETGIANYAHNKLQLRVPDKLMSGEDNEKVEGALVLSPKVGLHEWVGSVDINSLYPSVIRALNISPEMFIGQFEEEEAAWHGIMFGETVEGEPVSNDRIFVMRFDGGDFAEYGAGQWRDIVIEQKWAITSFGTVFDESRGPGLLPSVLTFWFGERKRLQAEKKKYTKLAKELRSNTGVELDAQTLAKLALK
jgi:DNA polymerase elongation subunit (family B)